MAQITVVIPNYNGQEYISACLQSLKNQTIDGFDIIVVDNASKDLSCEIVMQEFPQVQLVRMSENTGFSGAVNTGITAAKSPYVILLNNDTQVDSEFVEKLYDAIKGQNYVFSVAAKMLSLNDMDKIDDAGDFYTVLGWAFARGKGKSSSSYNKPGEIFSSCAGAAIYDRGVLSEVGYFDEAHFAYLEDLDVGWHARLLGYRNLYEPTAVVYHAGSASSGSRYNHFKVEKAAQNSVYVFAKNLSLLQIVLHAPLLFLGILVKLLFFIMKGFGGAYVKGLWKGFLLCFSKEMKNRRVHFRFSRAKNYLKVEWQLWVNMIRLLQYR